MKLNYQTRSQVPANKNQSRNSPLLPRVVTPVVRRAATSRVPAWTHNLSPRNLSQDDFWDIGTTNKAIALGTNNCTNIHLVKAGVHPITGKEMEYIVLMKDPVLQPLWEILFGNEVGRLFQGIRNNQGTKTLFKLNSKTSPSTDKSHMSTLSVTISLTKRKKNGSDSQWVETGWINPTKWKPPLHTKLHSKS
jgi:hypothetical protein